MKEEQLEEEKEEGRGRGGLVSFKKEDLKILKAMWDEGDEEKRPVREIVKKVYGDQDRRDYMDTYPRIQYRMDRMADIGLLTVEEADEGAEYKVSGDVFIGEMEAEMTYLGHTEEMQFDNVMFLNLDGVATFIALDNVDGV